MIAALDVHYTETKSHAAAVIFDEWYSDEPIATHTATDTNVAEYEPGKFYMRELSPLLKVISQIQGVVDVYVIDGYCHLSHSFAPGLGVYLHDALESPAAIVGVAKNRYRNSDHAVEVFRGGSKRPLFVTSIGMEYGVAAEHIQSMAGEFRIPAMLKAVDRLARTSVESEAKFD